MKRKRSHKTTKNTQKHNVSNKFIITTPAPRMACKQDLLQLFIDAIETDKRNGVKGIVRYELVRALGHRDMNCIDEPLLERHIKDFNSQGLFESERRNVMLGNTHAQLVIMRHTDSTKCFSQNDAFSVGYQKAGCELTFFEVNHNNKIIEIINF